MIRLAGPEEVELPEAAAGPPSFAIHRAEQAAVDSGCRTSRRGVAVYWSARDIGGGRELVWDIPGGQGTNGPPRGASPCDASDACQRDCGRRCVHAEVRAFLATVSCGAWCPRDRLRVVHVKIGLDGWTIPSGGPRCLPCATFLLDQGVGGVWLYEQDGLWRYYPVGAFYAATVQACLVYSVGHDRVSG